MLSLYGFAVFSLALFFLSTAGFFFSGNMLKKNIFAVIMFLSADMMLICLTPHEKPACYNLMILFISLAETAASFFIMNAAVRELHTFDSGSVKEDE